MAATLPATGDKDYLSRVCPNCLMLPVKPVIPQKHLTTQKGALGLFTKAPQRYRRRCRAACIIVFICFLLPNIRAIFAFSRALPRNAKLTACSAFNDW